MLFVIVPCIAVTYVCEQHGTPALIAATIDKPAFHVLLKPCESAVPVTGHTGRLQHRLPGPWRHRRLACGLFGIEPGRYGIVTPLRLDMTDEPYMTQLAQLFAAPKK